MNIHKNTKIVMIHHNFRPVYSSSFRVVHLNTVCQILLSSSVDRPLTRKNGTYMELPGHSHSGVATKVGSLMDTVVSLQYESLASARQATLDEFFLIL